MSAGRGAPSARVFPVHDIEYNLPSKGVVASQPLPDDGRLAHPVRENDQEITEIPGRLLVDVPLPFQNERLELPPTRSVTRISFFPSPSRSTASTFRKWCCLGLVIRV